MSYRTLRRLVVASIVVVLAGLAVASPVVADHGEGHNGETLEVSKSEGLVDGEVVAVTLTSWLPGKTVTVVTCYVYPAAGPSDCELSNYGTHTTVIGDDGTGTLEYPVAVVPGRCDETMPCLVVAGDGFGANANYAAQQFTFAAADAAEPDPAEEPAEETTEPDPAEETTEPDPAEEPAEETTEPDPAEETTEPDPAEEPAEETTEPDPAEETTEPEPAEEPAEEMTEPDPAEEPAAVTAEPEPAEETAASEAAAEADDDGGGGSVWVWLLPVIIAAVVLALVARLLMRRRSAA